MKFLILANNLNWTSWNTKTQFLHDWFKPVCDIEFTVRPSSLKNIPTELYTDSEGKQYPGIKFDWYDANISSKAKQEGFDGVILSQNFNEFVSFPAMGYTTPNNLGIIEIVIGSDENDLYNFQAKKYPVFKDRWTESTRHEICHALYNKKGLYDNTHAYYLTGNIDKILSELKQVTPIVTPIVKPITKYLYFTDKEVVGLKPDLVKLLDNARGIAGIPFKINSGYRTKSQNEKAGGVEDSAHLLGLAVDIACTTDSARDKILNSLRAVGFNRIGIAKTFVHCDIDKSKSPNRTWLYE